MAKRNSALRYEEPPQSEKPASGVRLQGTSTAALDFGDGDRVRAKAAEQDPSIEVALLVQELNNRYNGLFASLIQGNDSIMGPEEALIQTREEVLRDPDIQMLVAHLRQTIGEEALDAIIAEVAGGDEDGVYAEDFERLTGFGYGNFELSHSLEEQEGGYLHEVV